MVNAIQSQFHCLFTTKPLRTEQNWSSSQSQNCPLWGIWEIDPAFWRLYFLHSVYNISNVTQSAINGTILCNELSNIPCNFHVAQGHSQVKMSVYNFVTQNQSPFYIQASNIFAQYDYTLNLPETQLLFKSRDACLFLHSKFCKVLLTIVEIHITSGKAMTGT